MNPAESRPAAATARGRWPARLRTGGRRRAAALLCGTAMACSGAALGVPTAAAAPGLTRPATGSGTVGGAGLDGPGVLADVPAGVPGPPPMAAAAYLVADLTTGDVLVAKAPHAQHLPASTLKTLTALTVIPRLDPSSVVTAETGDLADGTRVGMMPGLTYTVHQLLQGMLMSSGNDAATALARVAGGTQGVAGTVTAMQEEAERLGARDTVVRDPSGLDAPGQVSSVYDMALFAREALKDPSFRALVTTKRTRFPGKPIPTAPTTGTKAPTSPTRTTPSRTTPPTPVLSPDDPSQAHRDSFQIQNHNTLLFNYDGAIGVKNGYTVAARWTIIGAAQRDGRTYVVTALARSDRSWRPTAALLDWAFAHGSQVTPIGRLVAPGELQRAEATTTPTSGPVAAGHGDVSAAAATRAPPRRWVGAIGLVAAALLVAAMGLRSRQQGARRPGSGRPEAGRGEARPAGPRRRHRHGG